MSILQAIYRLSLDNIAVVVTRWFGGILLGRGGLIRACGGTAAACLRTGKRVEIVAVREATITVAFSELVLVKARLASTANIRLRRESFTEAGATLMVDLPRATTSQIARMTADITSGRASVAMGSCIAI
jgi:putative IMPACT (imprinted ancient) family translation regulator